MPPADTEERQRAIALLVEAGADPMAATEDGAALTPLHFAASSGLADSVALFLAKGADASVPDRDGNTPLHWAVSDGWLNCTRVLLDHGAARDHPLWTQTLVFALLSKQIPDKPEQLPEVLKLLIQEGAPINQPEPIRGAYPIHQATFGGRTKLVEILLDAGVDPDITDRGQARTPLHVAASGNHREIVELLWHRGANLKAVDWNNRTPAQSASDPALTALLQRLERTTPPKPKNGTTR